MDKGLATAPVFHYEILRKSEYSREKIIFLVDEVFYKTYGVSGVLLVR